MSDSSSINDKTDYYELFGVDETASQEQLKKAYRKAAMKWHPDRNHNNIEEATRVFQIIEHAYSILSDPHERAWYDGHRHAVVNEFGEFDATNVDIEGLFGAGAFSGFNDGPNGFFTVFQRAFRDLADEEKTTTKIPTFGNSQSPYEKVAEFYNFWTCFTTKRSFAFKDIYHLKDAPNARYKRAMNQENEKARQKAQRDFVQSVRELALFAKKRDPRVKKHLEEVEKQNEERRKIAEQKKLERQKEVEKQLESILNDNSNPISYNENDIIYLKEFDKDEEEPQWHCDYCGRDMNTESAFKQHCNTKKHKKLSASARKDFLRDPSLFEHTKYTFMLLGLTDDEIEDITGKPASEFTSNQDQSQTQNKEEEEDIDEEVSNNKNKNNKKGKQNKKQNQNQKKKNNKSKNNFNDDDDDDDIEDEQAANDGDNDEDQNDDDDEIQTKNGKNKNNKNQNNQGKKGKGKNQNQTQNQNKNNQQTIPKKEKHKQKMQRQKEAREKAELEELEKQKQRQREEKEKIESIISKSQSSDQFSENINNNSKETENESDETTNYGPKLSKKEKKRLRQLKEARKRFLIQDEEEEDEKDKEQENEAEKENEENPQNGEEEKAENENENKTEAESTQNAESAAPKPAKKNEKVIEIIDENGKKVKVTMTDNFDDEPEVNNEDQDQDDDQTQTQTQNQNQNQNMKMQAQPKGKKNKKGPKKAPPGMFMCRKCHAVFPSKTKLFKHLEETNHATAYG